MTKAEAAELLNLSATAGTEEVRSRFQEMYSDYQIRLTNAPTPNLKKVYQKSLEDLRIACEVLHPGLGVESPRDLPSAQPVHGASAAARPIPPGVDRRIVPPTPIPPGDNKRQTVWLILAAVCASAAAFFAIEWMQATDASAKLRTFLSKDVNEQYALLKKDADFAPGLLVTLEGIQNGKFQICNLSTGTVRVTSLTSNYRSTEGKFKTFNSTTYDWYSWNINAGAKKALDFVRGNATIWDGSVIFYSLGINYRDQDYIVSGSWSDVKDGCIKLKLD